MKLHNTLKKVGIISCAVILVAALAGCGVSPATTTPDASSEQQIAQQDDTTTSTSSEPTSESGTEDYISEAEAKAIALAHAGINEADVSHMLCKLDYDDGVAEYEVEFWDGTTEYDYEINAVSGEIIGYDYDMESYSGNSATTPNASTSSEYIGEAQAKSIALAHAGVTQSEAGSIKCEFDFDDGRAEYDVEWRIGAVEYEYTISATDGTIWEHDVDYDD